MRLNPNGGECQCNVHRPNLFCDLIMFAEDLVQVFSMLTSHMGRMRWRQRPGTKLL